MSKEIIAAARGTQFRTSAGVLISRRHISAQLWSRTGPANDTVRITTGSAFDVKGSRRQTDFHIDQNAHELDESCEVTVTIQKAQPVEVTIVEHLNRGENWEITEKSSD